MTAGMCVKPDAQASNNDVYPLAPPDSAAAETGRPVGYDGPAVEVERASDGPQPRDSLPDMLLVADGSSDAVLPDVPITTDGPMPDQPPPLPDGPRKDVPVTGTGGIAMGGSTGGGGVTATGGALGTGGAGAMGGAGGSTTSVVDCGPLASPTNGSVVYPSTTVGSTATYTCGPGYGPSGSATRYCLADGKWSGVAPSCVIANCPGLPSPTSGLVSAPTLTFGSTATYTCESGYNLVGTGQRSCQADGSWSGVAPTCAPVDCGPLSPPANGTVDVPATTYPSTATYACTTGYQLSSTTPRKCQANSQWDGTAPTCSLVDCGTPTPVAAPLHVSATVTTYGSTASFSCDPGYELSSAATLTCQANGSWGGSAPACNPVSCGTLADPANGHVSLSGTTYGSVATYSCTTGATLVGDAQRTCQADKSWSGSAPTCQCNLCGGTTCLDLQTDRNNCGSCGNVCSISSPSTVTCALGRCLATLADGYNVPRFVTLDSSYVYWTNYTGGTVTRVPKGGGSVTPIASGQAFPNAITSDSSYLYWTGDCTVKKTPLAGGAITTLATLSSPCSLQSIAVDSSYVYFGNITNSAGQILRAPLSGSGASTLTSFSGGGPFGIAIDSSSIYFADTYGYPGPGPRVGKLPLAGGSVTDVARVTGVSPYYLALDGSYIYWTINASGTGAVMKTAKDGSSSTPIASNQDRPWAIAIDATNAYWTNLDGTIKRVALTGGAVTTLATGQNTPAGIAVDASSVYWANTGGETQIGNVMKVTPK